jgi:predicted P-loop ATPase
MTFSHLTTDCYIISDPIDPEMDGKPYPVERFYLELATIHHISASKEAAKDIVMAIAEQNEYNPVLNYLNLIGDLEGISIDNLATRYLGTTDLIYDIYIKKTLIAAVARPF